MTASLSVGPLSMRSAIRDEKIRNEAPTYLAGKDRIKSLYPWACASDFVHGNDRNEP